MGVVVNLADQLAEISVVKGPACKIGTWLAAQSEKHRADIEQAFRDKRVMHRVLAEWITSQDGAPKITASSVSHHRSGDCASCKRTGYHLER